MTSRDFVYWLQGFFEVSGATTLTSEQSAVIKNHLNLVFKHEIDPGIDGGNAIKKAELAAAHTGGRPESTLIRC